MNKKQWTALIIILIIIFITGIVDAYIRLVPSYNDKLNKVITTRAWERKSGGDTETIRFKENGDFSYSCSCGSPVDDYDLCDSYKYDDETGTIKLICSSGVKVTKLKIVEATEKKLVLDFDGEKREFVTEYHHLIDNPLPFAGIKYKTAGSKEDIRMEFTKEGTFEAFNKTKEKYDLGSDTCFRWTYDENKREIYLDCQVETRTIQVKRYDSDTTELELYFKKENKTL